MLANVGVSTKCQCQAPRVCLKMMDLWIVATMRLIIIVPQCYSFLDSDIDGDIPGDVDAVSSNIHEKRCFGGPKSCSCRRYGKRDRIVKKLMDRAANSDNDKRASSAV